MIQFTFFRHVWLHLNIYHENFEMNEEVTIVLGNETCDVDSAVCSLVYAYIRQGLSAVLQETKHYIPVLNINEEDKVLKAEVFYFLEKYGVPVDCLQFRDTIDLKHIRSSTHLEVILVDQHTLSERDLWLKSHVSEVIDHRPLDPDWDWKNTSKTVESVASCATLIAEKLINQDALPVPRSMLILLYENPKLYTEKDKIIVEELYRKISYPTFVGLLKDEELIDGDHLFEDLLSVRCNLTHLTVLQILKKDLKISCGIPIPVLPVLVQEFLKLHTIEELQKFTKDFEYKGIILIGVTFSNGRYAQDIAVFSTDKYFLDLMTDTLVTSRDPDLQLNEVTVYANMEYIKVFTQQNFKATRKQILPIVREFMRHFLSPPTEG
ncbi:exopolyphosphatase PRUNE1-like isoform X5 [Schistocerca serialis cubense]|uniref:exopolyphosphatase PRUNE1-like isoform X5 n=1 Tax=Schistocerca serialis cubense TaxID=2023355 RepID=UPI00214DFD65|nr:exopolyphosphatase PRUNE1-like isoform X5 [Schistocerca serialis cubense]